MQTTPRPSADLTSSGIRGLMPVAARLPKAPVVIVVLVLLTAMAADLLTDTVLPEANQIDLRYRYATPWPLEGSSLSHPLGTDRLGRDLLSRMIVGARNSMAVSLTAICFAAVVGTMLGLVSGYLGRWMDALIMRCVGIMLSFPAILVALVFVVTVGASFWMVVSILALLLWAHFARLVRGEVLSWKERDFVALAKVAGASTPRILVQHIFPNIFNSVVVLSTLQVGWAIVVES